MYNVLNLRDDVDRLYVKRKEGRVGVASIEHHVAAAVHKFLEYKRNSKEKIVTTAQNSNNNKKNNIRLSMKTSTERKIRERN